MQPHPKFDADIFLCHSTVDKAFVRRLARDLREVMVSAWFDEWELDDNRRRLDDRQLDVNRRLDDDHRRFHLDGRVHEHHRRRRLHAHGPLP